MAKVPPLISFAHTMRVKSFYKRALRTLECWYHARFIFRYHATLMRKRFDDDKCFNDPKVAYELLRAGEDELFKNMHWHPRKFWTSPGGTAYLREAQIPDWVLDYWHPLEKAQYPTYFARREERKKEYVKNWVQEYCPGDSTGSGTPKK